MKRFLFSLILIVGGTSIGFGQEEKGENQENAVYFETIREWRYAKLPIDSVWVVYVDTIFSNISEFKLRQILACPGIWPKGERARRLLSITVHTLAKKYTDIGDRFKLRIMVTKHVLKNGVSISSEGYVIIFPEQYIKKKGS